MSSTRKSTKRSRPEPPQSLKKPTPNAKLQDDLELDVSSDMKGIMSALQQIREKAQEDGRKKKEESISSVSTELMSKTDELKSKLEKDRQSFARAFSKSSKECENTFKVESAKFEEIHQKFMKAKADHLQGLKDTISKFEEDKERLYMRYEQLRKKEKAMISEHEKFCTEKLAQLEESLKKKKRDDKTFSILRKTLGSFLENEASDEDFPPDECSTMAHFFQPFLPGFHTHLNIPVAFFSKHIQGRRNNQNKTAKLRSDASDDTWVVKMDGLKLTHGWEDFTVAHDLRVGDVTVFRHEGDMVFHVTALGPSCCEIQYTPPHNINDGSVHQTNIIGDGPREKRVNKNPREKGSDHSFFVTKVSASSLSYDRLYVPRSFARSNRLTKMGVKKVVLVDQKGRSWQLDLKHDNIGKQTIIRPGWKKFCAANGMNNGHYTFELVKKSGIPIIRLCRGQHRPKAESSSYQSYFERCASLSSIEQDTLYLPKRFVKSNGLHKGCDEIVLKNERGGRWTLVLRHYKNQTYYLRQGWTSFCQENGIKAGDSFMLKLVDLGERPVLSLFPANSNRDKNPLQWPEDSDDVNSISSDNKSEFESLVMKKTKNCASSSYSQSRFVTLRLTIKAFNTYKMILPADFTRMNGINKPRKITLLGQDGVRDGWWILFGTKEAEECGLEKAGENS